MKSPRDRQHMHLRNNSSVQRNIPSRLVDLAWQHRRHHSVRFERPSVDKPHDPAWRHRRHQPSRFEMPSPFVDKFGQGARRFRFCDLRTPWATGVLAVCAYIQSHTCMVSQPVRMRSVPVGFVNGAHEYSILVQSRIV